MAKRLPGLTRHARDGSTVETEAPETPAKAKGEPSARKTSPKKAGAKAAAAKSEASKSAPTSAAAKTAKAASAADAPADATPPADAEPEASLPRALAVVRHHAVLAGAGGAIPLPLVDIAAVVAAQVAMVRDLCVHYGQPFSESRARTIVYALLGCAGTQLVGMGVFGSFAKFAPGLGTLLGLAATGGLSAAITSAMGRSFVAHFEAGGSLTDAHEPRMRRRVEANLARERARRATA